MISFMRAEARWLFAGFLLTTFSGFGQTFFISLSNTALRTRFDLTHGELGLAYAVATLASALILLEFGKIVDHVSTRRAALIVALGLTAACLVMALADAVWMLVLAFLGLRLFGQGMMGQVAMVAVGRWYEANRGRAVSLVSLGYPAGEAVLPSLAVAAMALFGDRSIWFMGAGAVSLLAMPLLFVLLAQDRTPQAAHPDVPLATPRVASPPIPWRRRDVLGELSFYGMLAGVLCPAFMMTGLFFHQLHLVEIKGWTPAHFALGFTAFAVTQVVSGLISGALVDRFSARVMLPVYLVPMALGLLLAAALSGPWVVFALMVLIGLTGGAASTVMGAIWPELFGPAHLGEIRALSFSAMVASSAASPLITGFLIDGGIPFPTQLAAMGAFALLACGLMVLIQPRLDAIASGKVSPRPV
ncbi:MAG: MFS transporter [Pseudomonadota bacterium]